MRIWRMGFDVHVRCNLPEIIDLGKRHSDLDRVPNHQISGFIRLGAGILYVTLLWKYLVVEFAP